MRGWILIAGQVEGRLVKCWFCCLFISSSWGTRLAGSTIGEPFKTVIESFLGISGDTAASACYEGLLEQASTCSDSRQLFQHANSGLSSHSTTPLSDWSDTPPTLHPASCTQTSPRSSSTPPLWPSPPQAAPPRPAAAWPWAPSSAAACLPSPSCPSRGSHAWTPWQAVSGSQRAQGCG